MAALCRGVFWQRWQGSPVSFPEARVQVPTGSPFSPPLAAVQSPEEAGACVPARLERCARANPAAWQASRSLWTGWVQPPCILNGEREEFISHSGGNT